ncbi:MAG TPA: Hsp20/alpha crystallin family protein [Candidatus Tectomicrobia bacterium]|nr:Hsp20/alpha crystallin family protein [Candidatus Tectomicrobia bacterium]
MMTLVRWCPARDVITRQRALDHLLGEGLLGSRESRNGGRTGSCMPPVDVYESDQGLMLKADLPGFAKDDVQVEIKGNVLTIKGERKRDPDGKGVQYHRVERAYGAFQRSFKLPASVNASKAEASFKAGVLELKLPKAEEAKPKRVEVRA